MHTGLDLHGETGEPVRATADGKVTAAGWSGGYGRSVDIDHGNGLSTRYGHHYETRVRGHAVDPQKFLRAGHRLEGSL